MMQTIFLIGPRGAGKTTIGKLLAKSLSFSFIDTDKYLLETSAQTVAQIVENEGWEGFRHRESQILIETASPNCVVATGGGMVLAEKNRQFMKQHGQVFFLSASPAILVTRLTQDPNATQRPSLTGLPLEEEIQKIMSERFPLYQDTAHHIIDVEKEKSNILNDILEKLR